MALVDSECPVCGKTVPYLRIWRKVGEIVVCICEDCTKRQLSETEILHAGVYAGCSWAVSEMRDKLKEVFV